jgi:hypothetical protein
VTSALSIDRVTEDLTPAPTNQRQPEEDGCTLCGLHRSEHGVQLIHRFIPPGQPTVTPQQANPRADLDRER